MRHRRITRAELVEMVGNALPSGYWDDLPAIRQALNDTADGWRRDGHKVGDFAQDGMVRAVQAILKAQHARTY